MDAAKIAQLQDRYLSFKEGEGVPLIIKWVGLGSCRLSVSIVPYFLLNAYQNINYGDTA